MNKDGLYKTLAALSCDPVSRLNNLTDISEIVNSISSNIDRSFFILHYKWGLDVSEIAECFGCQEQIVRTRLKEVKENIFKTSRELNFYE